MRPTRLATLGTPGRLLANCSARVSLKLPHSVNLTPCPSGRPELSFGPPSRPFPALAYRRALFLLCSSSPTRRSIVHPRPQGRAGAETYFVFRVDLGRGRRILRRRLPPIGPHFCDGRRLRLRGSEGQGLQLCNLVSWGGLDLPPLVFTC